jgi:pyruvate ferredoxin oxidoreductase gamma subunit
MKHMFQVRIHGRGGQGVVSAAEMLSMSAFMEDKHAQAIPSFGSERMGAPVVSYCRIDDKTIRLREPVLEPNALIVQDPTLFSAIDVFSGLAPNGYVLINSSKTIEELGIADIVNNLPEASVYTVPASELARQHVGKPLPNAALLGALAAVCSSVNIEAVAKAIAHKFPGKIGEANIAAARASYDSLINNNQESAPC